MLPSPTLRLAAVLSGVFCWGEAAMGAVAQNATPTSAPAEIVPSTTSPKAAAREVTTPSSPLSPGTKAGAETDGPDVQGTVSTLSDKELDEILALLKQRYINPGALSETELKRATVQGLLERLGASVASAKVPPAGEAAAPFRSELINNRIGYLRLGVLSTPNLQALDKALVHFGERDIAAQILDLRALPTGTDFEAAAEICRRWAPKGKPLFSVRRPGGAPEQVFTAKADPAGKGMLIVLTSSATAGSGEIIAGTLRAVAKAVVIGQKTMGDAAESADAALASGKHLRFAVAEVRLPGGQALGPEGITPDLAVTVTPAATTEILRLGLQEGGAAAVLAETERPRMNEAALVAGRNPEVDAMEAAQRTHGVPRPPVRDVVLQRAVDLVTSIEVFERKPGK